MRGLQGTGARRAVTCESSAPANVLSLHGHRACACPGFAGRRPPTIAAHHSGSRCGSRFRHQSQMNTIIETENGGALNKTPAAQPADGLVASWRLGAVDGADPVTRPVVILALTVMATPAQSK
jgi:hypothetical protein